MYTYIYICSHTIVRYIINYIFIIIYILNIKQNDE